MVLEPAGLSHPQQGRPDHLGRVVEGYERSCQQRICTVCGTKWTLPGVFTSVLLPSLVHPRQGALCSRAVWNSCYLCLFSKLKSLLEKALLIFLDPPPLHLFCLVFSCLSWESWLYLPAPPRCFAHAGSCAWCTDSSIFCLRLIPGV